MYKYPKVFVWTLNAIYVKYLLYFEFCQFLYFFKSVLILSKYRYGVVKIQGCIYFCRVCYNILHISQGLFLDSSRSYRSPNSVGFFIFKSVLISFKYGYRVSNIQVQLKLNISLSL